MGLALTVARKSLLRRPSRTLFSVLGIALGIATVVCVFTLDHNTVLGRALSQDPDWQAEIEVSPSAVVQDPRGELARIPGVSAVTASFQGDVMFVPGDRAGTEPSRVHLVALDARHAGELGAFRVGLGRLIDPDARVPEVLVGEELARDYGLAPGAAIVIARPLRAPARECVEGEWKVRAKLAERASEPMTCTVVGVLTREGLGRKGGGEVVVADYRYGAKIYEGAHVETRYWLKKRPEVDLENLEASLGQAWSYALKKSVIVGQAADERAFRNGVRFAGLLALVLGLYVIFHTLSMSLIERVREVGVLHALGASRAQIGRVFLTEALIVAGLGALAGIAGGLALARFLLRRGVTTFGTGDHINVFEVPWSTVLSLAGAGFAIALVGSIYPLARVRGTSAAAALRGEDAARATNVTRGFQIVAALLLTVLLPAIYFQLVPVLGESRSELVRVLLLGLIVLGLFVSLPLLAPALVSFACASLARPFELLWPFAGKLAARAMKSGPARVAGAIAGIGLVTAGYVGLRGMTRSLEAEIANWGQEAFLDKVYVRNLPKIELAALARHLERYEDVLGVEPGDARTYVPFLLIGVEPAELGEYGPCRTDPLLIDRMRAETGLIVSRRLANQQKYRVGDPVHVRTAGGVVKSLPVLAISDAYGYFPHPDERLYAVIDDDAMRRFFCIDDETVNYAAVRLKPGADPRTVETAVHEFLPTVPGIVFETGPYLYEWHTSDIARDFVVFDLILLLTVVLALVGVLNGQLLAALERSKELGVLKALGTSRGQIAGMVMLESVLVGILGGAVGVGLGWALSPVIVRALQTISGLALPSVGPGSHVAIAWAGAVAVACLAGLYPIHRMNRLSSVEAVRTPG